MKYTRFRVAVLAALRVPSALAVQQRPPRGPGRELARRDAAERDDGRKPWLRPRWLRTTERVMAVGGDAVPIRRWHRASRTALVRVGSAVTVEGLVHYVAQPNGFGMSAARMRACGGGEGILILGAQQAEDRIGAAARDRQPQSRNVRC
jgi:hypothetical protein